MANLIITNATNSSFCMNCGQPSEYYAKQVSSESSFRRLCAACINKWDKEIHEAKLEADRQIEELKNVNKITEKDNKSDSKQEVQVQGKSATDTIKEQPKGNEVKKGTVNAAVSPTVRDVAHSPVQPGGSVQKPNS